MLTSLKRRVFAALSLSFSYINYFAWWLFNGVSSRRQWTNAHDVHDASDMLLQSIESSDNGRFALVLVPPTKRVASPAIAYKMLCIRRLPPNVAPNCRRCCCCCCWCCARLGGHVMSAQQQPPDPPSSLVDGTPARLIAVRSSTSPQRSVRHRVLVDRPPLSCYCTRPRRVGRCRRISKRLIRDETRDIAAAWNNARTIEW